MGGALGKWYSPDKKKKDGSTLVEIIIPHIRDAHDVVGLMVEDYTPVVIVPKQSVSTLCGAPCCWVSIPTGFTAIVTRWGKDAVGAEKDGTWSPGFHCFLPWYSVSRLVAKQLIVFDTPVKDCKTLDNVTVTIDVLIVFCISDAKEFAYKIGPEKLDDLMRASQEEVLRQMAASINIQDIYDLHGKGTEHFVEEMNIKFAPYGVTVKHFTVRNVSIPADMAKDFEDKTLYESKTLEKSVQQEMDQLSLKHLEAQAKLREECDNKLMACEEQAVTSVAQITKELKEAMASTSKEWQLMEAKRKADVMDVHINSELAMASIQAEITTLKCITDARVEQEVGKLEAEANAYERQKRATGRMESVSLIAEGKKALATAEGDAADAFAARRAQERELKRLDILDKLGDNQGVKLVTSLENNTGLAPDNSLVTQIAQQGMEAFRMKLAEMTSDSAKKLDYGKVTQAGLVRPVPQQTMG